MTVSLMSHKKRDTKSRKAVLEKVRTKDSCRRDMLRQAIPDSTRGDRGRLGHRRLTAACGGQSAHGDGVEPINHTRLGVP